MDKRIKKGIIKYADEKNLEGKKKEAFVTAVTKDLEQLEENLKKAAESRKKQKQAAENPRELDKWIMKQAAPEGMPKPWIDPRDKPWQNPRNDPWDSDPTNPRNNPRRDPWDGDPLIEYLEDIRSLNPLDHPQFEYLQDILGDNNPWDDYPRRDPWKEWRK